MNQNDYPTEEELAAWPNCATPDCGNKCCRIMDSIYCSPCNWTMRRITRDQWSDMIDARRKELGLPVG